MSVAIDTKALNALVKDLAHAQVAVLMAAKGVVSKGALNIKRDAQSKVLGLKHAPAYPFSIGYDMHSTSTSVYAKSARTRTSARARSATSSSTAR
jgi:hypothetical protein